jgi:hypothetical protein
MYASSSNFSTVLKPADIQSNGGIHSLTGINTMIITEREGRRRRRRRRRRIDDDNSIKFIVCLLGEQQQTCTNYRVSKNEKRQQQH